MCTVQLYHQALKCREISSNHKTSANPDHAGTESLELLSTDSVFIRDPDGIRITLHYK